MQCDYFDAGVCRSCDLMGVAYGTQLAGKDAHARRLLERHPDAEWLPPLASDPEAFRSKAKMVVGGTSAEPTLGILDEARIGVDLRRCGVISTGIRAAFDPVAAFIARAAIEPYDVRARRGELKLVVVLEAPDGSLMIRFVLRSREAEGRMRKHLPALLAAVPTAAVVTINLQPEHKAVVEGPDELPLTPVDTLLVRLDDVTLHVRPGSFVQTNTGVASALYREGAEWVAAAAPRSVWDLYCGVGGFGLHVAARAAADGPGMRVLGVELSAEAIESARAAGVPGTRFEVGDATAFAERSDPADRPDVVIVNPPRRGLGARLAGWLEREGPASVLYSSCNSVSLAADLERMPSYRVDRARVFDMFPQSSHYELLTLLTRRVRRAGAGSPSRGR
ncbi:methyltransferase domain-containing protein [Galbitalea sp. SE-J8]|uniref:methyltransferase domain-containing protein n=1 Tax=Galbitalea sp. SE-J8 TaxID=3054952 RepID=UPI00259D154A|nr:methyltransferase domain-containing protein [Galbitalea sp. SE-J8]MDM4761593.1 methyltransferase domain-containing protein [Galbitalea sp. SE-J8]